MVVSCQVWNVIDDVTVLSPAANEPWCDFHHRMRRTTLGLSLIFGPVKDEICEGKLNWDWAARPYFQSETLSPRGSANLKIKSTPSDAFINYLLVFGSHILVSNINVILGNLKRWFAFKLKLTSTLNGT